MRAGRLVPLALSCLVACSGPTVDAPGTTYRSLEQLPDLGGWWLQEFAPEDSSPLGAPPNDILYSNAPFVPSVAAAIKSYLDGFGKAAAGAVSGAAKPDDSYDAAGYCKPPVFRGFNGELFNVWFEVLYTPGRVTLADEAGLVRRIDLDKPLPAQVEVSDAGTSVGHWEGQTLVVETRRKEAPAAGALDYRGPRSWGPMHIVERFSLKEPDLLQVDVIITAPEVFTRPFERSLRYRRDRQHEFHEETPCVTYDRFGDPAKGKQRFDLTPPSDLPPPPKD